MAMDVRQPSNPTEAPMTLSQPEPTAVPHDNSTEPRYGSILEDFPSSSEETGSDEQLDVILPEKDAQSVIGVSISNTQTRLASPDTPVDVRRAVLDQCMSDERAEDVPPEEEEEEDFVPPQSGGKLATDKANHQMTGRRPIQPLSSPWQPPGDKQADKKRVRRATLAPDTGLRRYFPSFSLPSLPKTPDLPNFLPSSLPSRIPFLRNRSSSHGVEGSSARRAERPVSLALFQDPLERWSAFLNRPPEPRRPSSSQAVAGSPLWKSQRSATWVPVTPPRFPSSSGVEDGVEVFRGTPQTEGTTSGANESNPPSRPPTLRRATSDNSLFLPSSLSRASSLGDDTRFDSVHEQVNSRIKAIKDSFRDSTFRLPPRPNISLNALHAEFPNLTSFLPSGDSRANKNDGMKDTTEDVAKDPLGTAAAKMLGESNAAGTDSKKYESSPHPSFDAVLPHLTGDIVIMGGYRGSILRSAKPPHRQVWIPVKVGLNLRKVDLEVGLEDEDEENMEQTIFPDGMLTHIGPVDISRRLIKRLKHCPNARNGTLRVWNYGYDWRLSPWLLSARLTTFLEGLPCNQPGVPAASRGAFVIAHSCGGLITRHAVNQNPALFAGVVYAGVPQTCVNILGPLRNGDQVLLSSRVLTAQVNFSFRTSFVFLPEDGRCFVDRVTGEEYPVNFFDPAAWERYAFSPCVAPVLPALLGPPAASNLTSFFEPFAGSLAALPLGGKKNSVHASTTTSSSNTAEKSHHHASAAQIVETHKDKTLAPSMTSTSASPATSSALRPPSSSSPLPSATTPYTYLTRTLTRTLTFKRDLHHRPSYTTSNAYPPHAVIYGKSIPTVSGARVASRDSIRRADAYDDLVFASGDGVALARESMLPEGYACVRGGRVSSLRGHVGLLGDLEAVGRALGAVCRARARGVGLGVDDEVERGREGGGEEKEKGTEKKNLKKDEEDKEPQVNCRK